MATVALYEFTYRDSESGELRRAWATSETISRMGEEPIPDTGRTVDADFVTSQGYYISALERVRLGISTSENVGR